MNRFDKDALTWDDLPRRVELAKAVVKNIKPYMKPNYSVLEFGCATGLVGINIAPYVNKLTGIDTSAEMINRFNEKASKLNINARGIVKNIFDIEEKYDVIISSMTLHHIKDIKKLSEKLYEISDKVFLADLLKEDGTFHTRGNEDVFHYGFSFDELEYYFTEWKTEFKLIHTVKKHKNFPVFLMKMEK